MTKQVPAREFRIAATLSLLGLLSGCFLADDDAANPIIPDGSLTYPIKFGDGRECEQKDDGDLSCERANFARLPDGGYSITVYKEPDASEEGGEEGEPTPSESEYKLRALSGPGVPEKTYLVQTISTDEGNRYLGLLKPSPRGGWLKISPNCDKLPVDAFVNFMNQGWLRTKDGATLENLTCTIVREGLDDARLYSILNSSKQGDNKILFSGG